MLHHIGVPLSALNGNLEELYSERLLELVRSSSLGAVVILAQELPRQDDGSPMEGAGAHYVPNSYVLDLARRNPEFLAGVSIHPARKDALDELERCLQNGAVLMKCLPNCQNIDCSDRRFTRFWERMAEAGLPLLAHTGGEGTLPVICPEFAHPRILTLPLECGVTVIAAHCATRGGSGDADYFGEFARMTEQFPNLYGDTSAFNLPWRGRYIRDCLRSPLAERILHGSDFPVPVYGHFSWLRGLVDWRTFRRWETQPNVLERDYQLKRAMGFLPETFTRAWELLRCPRGNSAEPQCGKGIAKST
jgi:predicted TIM-barrel fold metal-dependent hydrolase